jgi:hypothetical protein
VRPHAGQQLRQPERLDQVVVRAGVQAGDHVELLISRGEHQHRQVGVRGADAAADVEAVDVGQPQVEHHEVRVARRRWGRAAAGEPGDRVALALEHPHEAGGDRVVVLHEQDAVGVHGQDANAPSQL